MHKRKADAIKARDAWNDKNKPTKRTHKARVYEVGKFATTDGKPNVLIDDYMKNIKEWESSGGIGVHHTSVSKTLGELNRLGFK